MEADTAFANFGIKALSSMASATVGGVFNGFDPGAAAGVGTGGFMKSGLNGMVSAATGADAGAMALMKGSELLATSAVSNAASAITYSADAGLGWNYNQFAEGTFGTGAMAGYASGMLSTGISMGLGDFNLKDGNEINLSGRVFKTGDIRAFNNLAGGLASTGLTYVMTGSGVVNLANFNMFGSNISHGLLEMHFGEGGNYFKLGGSGTDISAGTMHSAVTGFGETKLVASFKLNGDRGNSTLNGINGLGYTKI
ncbi:MAG: hypothetical protein GXP33_03765 [Spirochaetes bacterium]|nr:hypothetical protein [Spirochaetota bacterium]